MTRRSGTRTRSCPRRREEVIAVDDDLQFRRALRALHAAHLEEVAVLISIPVLQSAETRRPPGWRPMSNDPDRSRRACRGSARRDRARPIRDGDAGAGSALVEHSLELPARDRLASRERRGEEPRASRTSAGAGSRSTSPPAVRTRPWRARGEGRRLRPGREWIPSHHTRLPHTHCSSRRAGNALALVGWLWCAGVRGACGACLDSPSLRPVESASRSSQ